MPIRMTIIIMTLKRMTFVITAQQNSMTFGNAKLIRTNLNRMTVSRMTFIQVTLITTTFSIISLGKPIYTITIM
jgi:hypothetical protein